MKEISRTGDNQQDQQVLKSVGQFFYGENLDEPAFVSGHGINGFKIDPGQLKGADLKKKVKSARWIADFTPKQTGLYTFITGSNPYTHMFVDGKELKDNEITLTEGEHYSAQTSGQDWSEQLGLNAAQAAYVNANIRYYNYRNSSCV